MDTVWLFFSMWLAPYCSLGFKFFSPSILPLYFQCSKFINFLRTATMRLGLSGSKVAIKSFVFSTGLVAEKQQFCATRLSDFHELSRAASPWGQLWQFWHLWQFWQFSYLDITPAAVDNL